MSGLKNNFTGILVFGLLFFGFITQANAQNNRVNQREVTDILRRLNVKVDDFRYNLDYELSRSSSNQRDEDEIKNYLDKLQGDLNDFQDKFTRRSDSQQDVSQLLSSAKNVDDFVNRKRLDSKLQRDWRSARELFNQLASNYGVSAYWNNGNQPYPTNNPYPQTNSYNNGLTGTYQLDTSRSENTRDIAEKAINDSDPQRRDDARRELQEKLEAPEQLAIDIRGNQVTLGSTLASQISFTADGRDRTETLPDGRTLRLRTTLRGQELTVASLGGDNDYTVVFSSIDNGRSLKVTRRVTTDYLNQTVFAESIYNKTDSQARLDIFGNPNNNTSNYPTNNYPTTTTGRSGQFIVPSGEILTGTLENDVSTKVSQNNDRFRMTVSAPNQFRGAVIEGYISGINRSGKIMGRSQLTFNFETIRLPNGSAYDFAGFLQSVTDLEGKQVKVDTEGAAKGDNQTKQTVTRGAIGAGLGALIGAIAGGGKGAAIGAIIGGSAGAGSVYIQGKDDLELKAGSSITVQSSSPNK